MRGWLSVVNRLVHKRYPHKPRFFHIDRVTKAYAMPPEVAALIRYIEPDELVSYAPVETLPEAISWTA